jgi:hypothetical protein
MSESLTARPAETTVLHVGGLHYASEKSVVEDVLGRRPGVVAVEANPVARTPRSPTTLRPRSLTYATGSRSAATTGPDSRCPGTSAIRWPRAPPPTRPWRTARRPSTARSTPTAMATADMPACRWRRWSATCAIASSSRSCSRSRSSSGRWSAPSCSAPSSLGDLRRRIGHPTATQCPNRREKAAKSEGRIRVGQALDSAQLQQVERDFWRRLRPLTSAGPAIVA